MTVSLSTEIFTILTNDPNVGALIGVRCYPDQIPQNAAYPNVVYRIISDVSQYVHEGAAGLADARVQFDCWGAASDLDSETLARLVRLALVGKRVGSIQFARKAGERSMPPDPTTLKRRHVLDLLIWHTEDQ